MSHVGKPLERLFGYRVMTTHRPFRQRFNRSLQRTASPPAELQRYVFEGISV